MPRGDSNGGPTVVGRFVDSVERRPEVSAVTLIAPSREPRVLSRAALYRGASRAAAGLREHGLTRGDRIVIALPTSADTLSVYLAALFTGIIPVITPAPRGRAVNPAVAGRLLDLALRIGARRVLVPEEAVEGLGPELAGLRITPAEIMSSAADELPASVRPDDIAHLQTTSGTTGEPRVAEIRHRNIGANVAAIGHRVEQGAGDRIVSWLPLYHDMGLICLSCALLWQRELVLTDAANFVRHPINYWLRLISTHGGTLSPAPTSAYRVCARLAGRRKFEDLDLSTWRVAFCGAEPVHRTVLESFQEAFAPRGLDPRTLLPVYGLAEATLAATLPDTTEIPHVEELDAAALEAQQRAQPAAADAGRVVSMVSVGRALAGHRVRVVDAEGRELGERQVGEIEFAGPSVIEAYWGESCSRGLKRSDGYLRTGDLGYLAAGELYVTGRKKEIILIRGRNLTASQLEAAVPGVAGIYNGVAAVGIWNEDWGTEELHLLVESRVVPPADRLALEEKIRSALEEAFDVGGVTVHWLRKGAIPKTSSGKIQRYRCREMVAAELAGAEPPPAVSAGDRSDRGGP